MSRRPHRATTRSPGRPPALGLVLLALLAVGTACSTRQTRTVQPQDEMAGMAPMLSVERFLQASNARDFQAMARIFGTADGSIAERQGAGGDVERRMALIADVLRHDDYRIVSESRAPGRENPTNRIGVTLTQGRRVVPDVAFVVVQADEGRWFVECVDLEKIMGTSSGARCGVSTGATGRI